MVAVSVEVVYLLLLRPHNLSSFSAYFLCLCSVFFIKFAFLLFSFSVLISFSFFFYDDYGNDGHF